jgi:HEAT repeat protein
MRFGRSRSGFAAPLVCLFCAGCGGSDAPVRFELQPVVAPAIAELERALETRVKSPAPAMDSAARDRVRELARRAPSAGSRLPPELIEEMRSFGDAAVVVLAPALADPSLPAAQRASAAQLLGVIGTSAAMEPVLSALAGAEDPGLRRAAAESLRNSDDAAVPFLIARLGHELDEPAVVWIGATLCELGNESAIERLIRIAERLSPAAGDARAALASCSRAAGIDDPKTIARVWSEGDPERKLPEPRASPRHRLEIWKRIRDTASDDRERAEDARFVLANEAPWVVDLLARALHETDERTRVAAARCLASLRSRARSAGPALVLALSEPSLAPDAAFALGEIGYAQAWKELARRMDADQPLPARVAAARALGRLNLDQGVAPLRAAFASDPPSDLRRSAAQSLVELGHGDEVASWLAELLASSDAGADEAERALEYWLAHSAPSSRERSMALERWRKLAAPPGIEPDAAAASARRAARAEIVKSMLAR